MSGPHHDLIVLKEDVRAAGFCAAGLKEWCRLNGFSASEMRDGILASRLTVTGCQLAAAVVRKAEERVAARNGEEV